MVKNKRTFREKFLGIFRPLFWLLAIGLTVVWVARLLTSAYPPWWFALIALPAAWILFVLRVFQRAIYGFVEVIIGTITVTNTYSEAMTTNVNVMADTKILLTLAAGVYIVIRGLDNIDQGFKQWCANFLHPDDIFSFTFYWEVGVKGRFLSKKLKRNIYLKMVRPLFKDKWIEYDQISHGMNKEEAQTVYWWQRKHFAINFMNERAVWLCRGADKFRSRGSKRLN